MKRIIALALVLACIWGISGCQKDNSSATTQPYIPEESQQTENPAEKYRNVALTMWSMWSEDDPRAAVLKDAAEMFKQHTGAVITIVWKGSDIHQQLPDALKEKESIDIFQEDFQVIAQQYTSDTLDLTQMADAAGYAQHSYSILNDQVITWAGCLNSIVETPHVGGIFFSKDTFERAGISKVPTTWEDFLNTCKALRKAGIDPFALDSVYADFTFYCHMCRHLSEEQIADLSKNGNWTKNPGAAAAAQELVDFVKAGYLSDNAPDEYPGSQNRIARGQASMMACAENVTAEVNTGSGRPVSWGMFPYPAAADSADSVYASAESLAVSATCQNPQAAFDFIMLLTSGKTDQLMADTGLQIPADCRNTAPALLSGTAEALLGAQQRISWCEGLEISGSHCDEFRFLIDELFSGSFQSGEEFTRALDSLYQA